MKKETKQRTKLDFIIKNTSFENDSYEKIRDINDGLFVNPKNKGKINTPLPLVKEMISILPEEAFEVGKKVLDPACKNGIFLKVIHMVRQQLGQTKEEIQNDLYGFDPDPVMVSIAKHISGLKNIYIKDFIREETNMRFDVILANPPYQNGKDLKFYWKFIDVAKKLINHNGSILYISPKSWLYNSRQYKDIIRSHDYSISYINLDERLQTYFPDIGSSFCIYHIVRKVIEKTKVITFDGEERNVDLRTFKGDIREKYIFNTMVDKIFSKLYKNGKIIPENGKGQNSFVKEKDVTNGYVFPVYLSSDVNRQTMWADERQKGQNSMKLIVSHIINPGQSTQFSEISFEKGVGRYSFFYRTKDKNTAENIQKFFDTNMYKFIDKIKRYGRYAYMTLPNLDFSKDWTDEEIYDFFDFTKEEMEYIENV